MITVEQLMGVISEIITDDQMRTLAERLQEIGEAKEEPEPELVGAVNEDFTVVRKSTSPLNGTAVKAGENTWSDDGEEKDDIDNKIVRKKVKHQPRETGKVERQCSVCNKTVKVPRIYLNTHYYRCEACCGAGG